MTFPKTIPRWLVVGASVAIPVVIIGGVMVYSRQSGRVGAEQQRQRLLREFRLRPTPFRSEYMTLVDLSRAARDYPTAIAVLKAAALEEPKNAFIFERLGDVYQEQGNDSAADSSYRRAILDDATGVVAYIKLADLLWERKREQAADIELLLSRGISVTAHPNLYKRLARYFMDIGDRARALETWQQVAKLEPNNAGVLEEIARLKR